jgi:small subunit ribosomal protein S14
MGRYLKLFKDLKKRQTYKVKERRLNKLNSYFSKVIKTKSRNDMKNLCQTTGSARSYYRQFAISRHSFRKNASLGLMPGITKSSW